VHEIPLWNYCFYVGAYIGVGKQSFKQEKGLMRDMDFSVIVGWHKATFRLKHIVDA
jgi:hypothetical protein